MTCRGSCASRCALDWSCPKRSLPQDNNINLFLLMLGALLHRTPAALMRAVTSSFLVAQRLDGFDTPTDAARPRRKSRSYPTMFSAVCAALPATTRLDGVTGVELPILPEKIAEPLVCVRC
jgi:hypothetical protein